ncbi:hypothetical protein LCGC14_0692490, partial [marine sediment metagenome]
MTNRIARLVLTTCVLLAAAGVGLAEPPADGSEGMADWLNVLAAADPPPSAPDVSTGKTKADQAGDTDKPVDLWTQAYDLVP